MKYFLIIISLIALIACEEEETKPTTSTTEEEVVEEIILLDEQGECVNFCKKYTNFSKDSIKTFFLDQKDSSIAESTINQNDWEHLNNSLNLNLFYSLDQKELDTLFPPIDGLRSTLSVKTNFREKTLLFSSNTFLLNYRNKIIEIRSKYE